MVELGEEIESSVYVGIRGLLRTGAFDQRKGAEDDEHRGIAVALRDPSAKCRAERGADILGELTPGDHVEEAGLLVPFLGLLVAPRTVHRDAEGDLRNAAGRVTHLGIPGDVARDGD